MTRRRVQPRGAVICMVTPGFAITDSQHDVGAQTDVLALAERVASLVTAAVESGVDLVQIREPGMATRHLFDLVCRLVKLPRATTKIVVNDRVDVALAAGADGVHLGSRSLPASRVREIAPPGFLIGCSVHGVDEARRISASGSANYLIAGTVLRTRSKPSDVQLLGTDGLAAVVAATDLPVLAIGGIDLAHVGDVTRAGAAGFAAIGLFADTERSGLGEVVKRARAAFDSANDDSRCGGSAVS